MSDEPYDLRITNDSLKAINAAIQAAGWQCLLDRGLAGVEVATGYDGEKMTFTLSLKPTPAADPWYDDKGHMVADAAPGLSPMRVCPLPLHPEGTCGSCDSRRVRVRPGSPADASLKAKRAEENERLRRRLDFLSQPQLGGLGADTAIELKTGYWEGRREVLAILQRAIMEEG